MLELQKCSIQLFDMNAENELRKLYEKWQDKEVKPLEKILAEIKSAPLALVIRYGDAENAPAIKLPRDIELAEGVYYLDVVFSVGNYESGVLFTAVKPMRPINIVEFLGYKGLLDDSDVCSLREVIEDRESELNLLVLVHWVLHRYESATMCIELVPVTQPENSAQMRMYTPDGKMLKLVVDTSYLTLDPMIGEESLVSKRIGASFGVVMRWNVLITWYERAVEKGKYILINAVISPEVKVYGS